MVRPDVSPFLWTADSQAKPYWSWNIDWQFKDNVENDIHPARAGLSLKGDVRSSTQAPRMACKASACSNVCNSVAVRRLREAQWRSLCFKSGYRRLATPATGRAFQAWEQNYGSWPRGGVKPWSELLIFAKVSSSGPIYYSWSIYLGDLVTLSGDQDHMFSAPPMDLHPIDTSVR